MRLLKIMAIVVQLLLAMGCGLSMDISDGRGSKGGYFVSSSAPRERPVRPRISPSRRISRALGPPLPQLLNILLLLVVLLYDLLCEV